MSNDNLKEIKILLNLNENSSNEDVLNEINKLKISSNLLKLLLEQFGVQHIQITSLVENLSGMKNIFKGTI